MCILWRETVQFLAKIINRIYNELVYQSGSHSPEWWLSDSGQVAQFAPEYSIETSKPDNFFIFNALPFIRYIISLIILSVNGKPHVHRRWMLQVR